MGLLNSIFGRHKSRDNGRNGEILSMVEIITKLRTDLKREQERADHFRQMFTDLRNKVENGEDAEVRRILYGNTPFGPILYDVKVDDDYVRIFNNEGTGTISFRREFDTTKGNHNWVDMDTPLITLIRDNTSRMFAFPTIIKAPESGIFEFDKNKMIGSGEEICRIKRYNLQQKTEIIEALERQSIKDAVYAKERKKMIERETLDELIAEGRIFNIVATKEGNRISIPKDVANAVWNRDGGCCCICGSNENLEFDHIIPISKGGATTFRNLQLLCHTCNLKKSDII